MTRTNAKRTKLTAKPVAKVKAARKAAKAAHRTPVRSRGVL
jgi:hypothetical protein